MANQLWATGTNGFITTPFSVLTTEFNPLANGNTVLNQRRRHVGRVHAVAHTASGVWGRYIYAGGGVVTPSSGGYLAGWWITKDDNSGYQLTALKCGPGAGAGFSHPAAEHRACVWQPVKRSGAAAGAGFSWFCCVTSPVRCRQARQ